MTAPTLLLWGADDRVVPPHPHMQECEALLPGAATAVCAGAGHMVVLEQPQQAAGHVAEYLRRPAAAPAVAAAVDEGRGR